MISLALLIVIVLLLVVIVVMALILGSRYRIDGKHSWLVLLMIIAGFIAWQVATYEPHGGRLSSPVTTSEPGK